MNNKLITKAVLLLTGLAVVLTVAPQSSQVTVIEPAVVQVALTVVVVLLTCPVASIVSVLTVA